MNTELIFCNYLLERVVDYRDALTCLSRNLELVHSIAGAWIRYQEPLPNIPSSTVVDYDHLTIALEYLMCHCRRFIRGESKTSIALEVSAHLSAFVSIWIRLKQLTDLESFRNTARTGKDEQFVQICYCQPLPQTVTRKPKSSWILDQPFEQSA